MRCTSIEYLLVIARQALIKLYLLVIHPRCRHHVSEESAIAYLSRLGRWI